MHMQALRLAGAGTTAAGAIEDFTPISLPTPQCAALPQGAANRAPFQPGIEYGSYDYFCADYSFPGAVFPAGGPGLMEALAERDALTQFLFQPGGPAVTALRQADLLRTACGGNLTNCVTSLDGFASLYASLPPELQPALANFTRSDAAFARRRLTTSPLLLAAVSELPAGMEEGDIVGLDQLIAATGLSLAELLAAGRVFAADFTPLAGLLDPSPGKTRWEGRGTGHLVGGLGCCTPGAAAEQDAMVAAPPNVGDLWHILLFSHVPAAHALHPCRCPPGAAHRPLLCGRPRGQRHLPTPYAAGNQVSQAREGRG